MKNISKKTKSLRYFRMFQKDEKGLSAIEFAMLAPVMASMALGAYEISDALKAYRRSANVGSTIGDLTTQATSITDNEMNEIFNAGKAVIAPLDVSKLHMKIFSIEFDNDGNPIVAWAEEEGWDTDPAGCLANIPEAVQIPNRSVVCSESKYDYVSVLEYFFSGVNEFDDRYYLVPRKTISIQRVP